MDAQKYYDKKLEKNSDSEIRSAMEKSGLWTKKQLQGVVSATLPVPSSLVTPPVPSSAIPVAATPSPLEAWATQEFPAQTKYAGHLQKYVRDDREKAKFLLKTQDQPSGWDPARLVETYPNDPNIPASLRTGQLDPNDQAAQAWAAARHYDQGEAFINRIASGGGDPRESNEWLNDPGKRAAMRHAYFLVGEKGVSDAIGHAGQQYLSWIHQNMNVPLQEHMNAMMAVQPQYANFPTNLRPSPVVTKETDPALPVVTKETDPALPVVTKETEETPKEQADKLFTTMLNVRSPLHDLTLRPVLGVESLRHPFAQFARTFNDMLLIPGLVTAEEEPGFFKRLHGRIDSKIQQVDIDPQDATITDDILGALGSIAAMFIPSMIAARGTLALAKGGAQAVKLAEFLSRSGVQVLPAAFMEAGGESGRAYQDILAQGGDAEAARWTATKLFGVNITVNAMLNKLSGIFDALPREARQQGFTTLDEATSWLANNPGIGGKAARAAIEGVQEMEQNVAGALARGKNVDVANMFYEGGIGSIAAVIFGLRGRRGRPIEEVLREGKQRGLLHTEHKPRDDDANLPDTSPAGPEEARLNALTAGEEVVTPEVTEGEPDVTPTDEIVEETDVTPEEAGEAWKEAREWNHTEGPPGFRATVTLASGKNVKNLYPDEAFDQLYYLVKEGWGDVGGVDRGGTSDSSLVEEMLPSKSVAKKTGKAPVLTGQELETQNAARKATGYALKRSLQIVQEAENRPGGLTSLTEEEAKTYQRAQNFLWTYNEKVSGARKLELNAWLTGEKEGGWSSKELEQLGVAAKYAEPVRVPYELEGMRQGTRQLKEEIGKLEEREGTEESHVDWSRHQQVGATELSPENKALLESGAPFSLLNVEGMPEETARTLGIIPQSPAVGPKSPQGGEATQEEQGTVVDRPQRIIQRMKDILGDIPSGPELEARKGKPPKPVTSPKEYAETHPEVLAGTDPPRVIEARGLDEIVVHEDLDALVKRAGAAGVHIADVMVPVRRSREALDVAAAENVPLPPVRADAPWRWTEPTNVPPREAGIEEGGEAFEAVEQDVSLPPGLEAAGPIRIHIPRPGVIKGRTSLESEKAEKITRANIARREDASREAKVQSLEDPQRGVQESESEAAKIIRQRLLASKRAHYMYEGEQRKAKEAEERRAMQGEGTERDTAFKEEVNIPTEGLRKRYPPYTPEEVKKRKAEQRATARLGRHSSYTEKLTSPLTSDESEIPYRRAVRDQKISNINDVAALTRNTTEATDPKVIELLQEHVRQTNVTRGDMKRRVELEYALAADPSNVANQKELRKIIDAQTLSPEAQAKLDALVGDIGAAIEKNQKTTGSNAGDSIVLPAVGSRRRKDITNRLIDSWSAWYRKKRSTYKEQREAYRNKYKRRSESGIRRRADARAAAAARDLKKKKEAPILSPTLEEGTDPIPETALKPAAAKKTAKKKSDREKKDTQNAKARMKRAAAAVIRKNKKEIRDKRAKAEKLRKQTEQADTKARELEDREARREAREARKVERAKKAAKPAAKKARRQPVPPKEKKKSEKAAEGQSWAPARGEIVGRPPKNVTDPAVIDRIRALIAARRRLGETFEQVVDHLMDPDGGLMKQYTRDEVRSTVVLLVPESGGVSSTAVVSRKKRARREEAVIPTKETPDVTTDLTTRVPGFIQTAARDLKIEKEGVSDADMVALYETLNEKEYPMPGTPEARKAQLRAWASQK